MTTDQENYTRWLAAEIQAAIDDPRPNIPHEEVMAQMADLVGDGSLEPAFLDDDGPSADLPRIVSTTKARELFGLRPGESVVQATARKAKAG